MAKEDIQAVEFLLENMTAKELLDKVGLSFEQLLAVSKGQTISESVSRSPSAAPKRAPRRAAHTSDAAPMMEIEYDGVERSTPVSVILAELGLTSFSAVSVGSRLKKLFVAEYEMQPPKTEDNRVAYNMTEDMYLIVQAVEATAEANEQTNLKQYKKFMREYGE